MVSLAPNSYVKWHKKEGPRSKSGLVSVYFRQSGFFADSHFCFYIGKRESGIKISETKNLKGAPPRSTNFYSTYIVNLYISILSCVYPILSCVYPILSCVYPIRFSVYPIVKTVYQVLRLSCILSYRACILSYSLLWLTLRVLYIEKGNCVNVFKKNTEMFF